MGRCEIPCRARRTINVSNDMTLENKKDDNEEDRRRRRRRKASSTLQ